MLAVCEIFYGEPKNLPERCNKILTYLDFTPWFAKKLAPDEAYTIHLDELLNVGGGEFGTADLSIKIEYYPWNSDFETTLGTDGKLWWKDRPLDK